MQEMTKEYVSRTIQEENLWKEGKIDTFSFKMSQMWEFTLRKEEKCMNLSNIHCVEKR